MPREQGFRFEYFVNKPWMHSDMIAPFDFAISKSEQLLLSEKNRALGEIKPYFTLNTRTEARVHKKADSLFLANWQKSIYGSNASLKTKHQQLLNRIIHDIYKKGLIRINDVVEQQQGDQRFYVVKNKLAEEKSLNEVFTLKSAFIYAETILQLEKKTDRTFVNEILESVLENNIMYDPVLTQKIREEALQKISLSKGMKFKGELVISRGDMIDEEKFQLIESLRKEYTSQSGGSENRYYLLLGQALITSMGILMIILFLYYFRIEILIDNAKFSFILMMIFLITALTGLSFRVNLLSVYIIPFCIVPVLVRAFLDTRTALFTHLASVLIIGQMVPNPFEFTFVQLTGGIFTIFSIINLRNRSQLFLSVLIIFLAYSIAYIGLIFTLEGKFTNLDISIFESFAISSGLTLFAYPLIFVFEKLFGFVSDVSLLELSNISSPLLRELALKAPGTFQHSLQVANLAEEASHKIGGSPLLARVGALYHDIGKSSTPMYFIENQISGVNPHNELSYTESAAIIVGHVHTGIEKAKENNIPDILIDFIRTHHGTTTAEFFLKMEKENRGDEQMDESVFRYPGPLPYSIETSVVMMADAVEAASRSLKKVDARSIDNLVESIINHQVEQNQFSNAPITFKHVSEIKKIFKRRLLSMNHLRIEYPK